MVCTAAVDVFAAVAPPDGECALNIVGGSDVYVETVATSTCRRLDESLSGMGPVRSEGVADAAAD